MQPTRHNWDMSEWPTFSPTTYPPTISPTEVPSLAPTTGAPFPIETCSWHVNMKTNDGCTDDNKISDSWLHPEMKFKMFYLSAKECCDHFFPDRPCKIVETDCSTLKKEAQDCPGTHGWHIDRGGDKSCTNSDDVPQIWLDDEDLKAKMLHPTSKGCCDHFFPNEKCKTNNVADCSGSEGGPDGEGSVVTVLDNEGCEGARGWHVNTATNDGCSDSNQYPQSWEDENLAVQFFKSSWAECCDEFFAGRECKVYDNGCNGIISGGGDAPPGPVPPPSGSSRCHGWHMNKASPDGCIDDENIDQAWLNENIKHIMLHPTSEACCNHFFQDRECKVYEVGCTESAPGPGPADDGGSTAGDDTADAGTVCGGHGWHVDKNNNDGCSNDDNFTPAWLDNPGLKEMMFYTTPQACCDHFFKGKAADCQHHDCNGGGPAPPPPVPQDSAPPPDGPQDSAPPPVPPPPVPPPGPASSNSALSKPEGFEDGSLGVFTTEGKPWTITDEFSASGSKSIKNSNTSRGESSKLVLSMDVPSDGTIFYELRHDVFVPWHELEIRVDGTVVGRFAGHDGEPTWETQKFTVKQGTHEIVWDVFTKDMQMPPVPPRGEGNVWLDDIRFVAG